MHIIERYALSCGLKIDNPYIYPKFFPIIPQKFITLHGSSKPSKVYDYWQEVIDILYPILKIAKIDIIQIGDKDSKIYGMCYSVVGQTSIGQVAYLVSKTELHLGVDSFPMHLAGYFDKPIVALFSNCYPQNARPYWGDPNKHKIISSKLNHKPSFSHIENPKSINTILPETIAKSVCELLNLPFEHKYQTIFLGENPNNLVETVPNQVLNSKNFGLDFLVVRMDFLFNEQCLAQQLSVCPCSIITDKPINPQLITQFKSQIKEIHYEITSKSEPNFLRFLRQLGIKFNLFSYLGVEEVKPLKLALMDFGLINLVPSCSIANLQELKKQGKIFYKSSKFTLSSGKIYPSKYAYLNDLPIGTIGNHLCQLPENEELEFWKEKLHFRLFQLR